MSSVLSRWKKVAQSGTTPAYSVFTGFIEKSDSDSRDYRILRLENGLQAVLVHDLHADKTAACVDVAVGHLQDPFGTGNLESLTATARKKLEEEGIDLSEADKGDGGPIGREVRKGLIEWWEKEYCASRMSLAVIGTVFVKTVKDYHGLQISWLLPDQAPLFLTRPAQYIAHFLGHEGPGSICTYLKKKGWLMDISAAPGKRNRSVQTLIVDATLTREGYRHPNIVIAVHYEDVVMTIFNYLSLLRTSHLEAYHHAEIKQMSATSFRFREKIQPHTYVRTLALDLLEPLPTEQLLSNGMLALEWDENTIRETLNMIRPETCRVLIMARDHGRAFIDKDVVWSTEKWYGTEYFVKRLSEDFVKQANGPNENTELFLPRPNPYIPEDLTVIKIDAPAPATLPQCIRRTSLSSLWYKKDDQFWVPKAQVKLNIRSYVNISHYHWHMLLLAMQLLVGKPMLPYSRKEAGAKMIDSRLLVDLLKDALSEVTYDAQLAGLDYSVSNHSVGLQISISGYNDKLPILLDTVLLKLKNLIVDPERLKVMLEQLSRSYKNFYLGQPSNLSQHFTSYLLSSVFWTPEEKLAELPYVNHDDVDRHKHDILAKVYVETLVTGNIGREQAIVIMESIEQRLGARALAPSERPRERSLLLPAGANFVASKIHANPKETNSALTYYCQFGDIRDARLRAALELIIHIINEPAFTQLRTVEQLGYVVATSMWTAAGSMGLGFKLQSLKPSSVLEQRVEAFIETYRGTLAAFTQEELDAKKEALIMKLLERAKNLKEETSRFWYQIETGYYDFFQNATDASAIETLGLEEIMTVYDTFLLPKSKLRKKLSLHLASQQPLQTDVSVSLEGITPVHDEAAFKTGLSLSPAALPVLT
ncbi:hypothetical protein PHLCEN_2v39 [Hermanssonia centrifuga]|uniref:Uncharacterized protein n=1 Tax=Hermanssonia centrifuga TaxID=98765 RepID=A0A2R6S7A6_9APHY|nr:hypothetical protein PHLCEN_2v39 [Hermanssonia centrifuga]